MKIQIYILFNFVEKKNLHIIFIFVTNDYFVLDIVYIHIYII